MDIYNSGLFESKKEADEFLEALYIVNKVAKKYRNTGRAYFEEKFCYRIKKDAIHMILDAGVLPDGYHSYKLPGQKHRNYRMCWILGGYPYHDEQISAVKTGKNKSDTIVREEFERLYHVSLPDLKYLGEIKDLIGSNIDKKRHLPGNGKGNAIKDTERYFKTLINKLYDGEERDDMIIKISRLRDIGDITSDAADKDIFLKDVEDLIFSEAI